MLPNAWQRNVVTVAADADAAAPDALFKDTGGGGDDCQHFGGKKLSQLQYKDSVESES